MKNSNFRTPVFLQFLLLHWFWSSVAIQTVAGFPPTLPLLQENAEIEIENAFESQQRKALEQELKRLNWEIGLEDKYFEAIKQQVDKQLIEGAASLEKAIGQNGIVDTCFLSRELANAIFEAVEQFVDEQAKPLEHVCVDELTFSTNSNSKNLGAGDFQNSHW